MRKFNCLNDFINHLIHSIKSGKDVYIYNYVIDDDTDYQFEKEGDVLEYYVASSLDIYGLQRTLSYLFMIDEPIDDIHIALDFYKDNDCELVERLFIFRCK